MRIDADLLVHERGGDMRVEPIATLAAAAEFVGVDLSADFSVGDETPALPALDDPLTLDGAEVRALGDWWAFGVQVIDHVVGMGTWRDAATTPQLWPEHFDVGTTVTVAGTDVNLGASPGDDFEQEPYLYVGPTTPERPGDQTYWNAPFGAVRRAAELGAADERRLAATDFVRDGIHRFASR